MLSSYNWPGKYRPFAHQVTTTEFLVSNRKSFCFNEAGTGKTACAIWASDFLLSKKAIRRVLVICPLSIVDAAWRNDLFTFAMHRSCVIAHGTTAQRRKAVASGTDYVIINFDGVGTILPELLAGGFDLIIVDECNSYKNSQIVRYKVLQKLVAKAKGLWLMTGTPAAQSPTDAYGLAKLVCPDKVPRYFGAFRDMVMYKAGPFKWLPKANAQETVFNVLQPAIRFEKRQCLDLPPITYVDRYAPMTPQQTEYYKRMKRQGLIAASGEQITSVNAAAMVNKLLQIACGSAYTDDGGVLEFDASARLGAMKEIIDETQHKAIVFVPHRHVIARVYEYLVRDKIKAEVIQGGVRSATRNDIIRRFQNSPDTKVLVLQPRTTAHGVTLTTADTVIWYTAPLAGVDTYIQGNARVDRAGQKNPMTVYRLQGSPIEEKMYKALHDNVELHVSTVTLFRQEIEEE
ncbi:MAG: DEAD/DEAH box helicase [Nitrosomonas sp.]|nr:DEAD/DEAH box helicase [Nitrosomonas sp.]